MSYRVRTPDGELAFPSLAEVEKAYAMGLVGPEDELREDGASTWRKAGSLPALASSRRSARATGARAQRLPILLAVGLSLLALYLIIRDHPGTRLLGVGLALVVAGLLMRVTSRTFGRGKRLL